MNEKEYYSFLKEMVLIRKFEEKVGYLYGLRKIRGFCHLYIGQEAISVGSIHAIDLKKDYVITTYRDHGHAISCGIPIKEIMCELYGKKNGCSKGKGGSMHIFDTSRHMYGGHAIVGSHLPLATGMAFTLKYKKKNGVILCYFGEGAIQMGTFHESLNLARLWNLPIFYICENNQYSMGTSFNDISSVKEISRKINSYDIEYIEENGMDVLTVYKTILNHIEKVRLGNPIFINFKTYRYKGHSMTDSGKYRSKEELEKYKKLDPILKLREYLFLNEIIDDNDYIALENYINEEIDKAVDYAENSEDLSIKDAYEDIYV